MYSILQACNIDKNRYFFSVFHSSLQFFIAERWNLVNEFLIYTNVI